MKIKSIVCLATVALALLLVHPISRATASAGPPPERHPQIRMALRALTNARQHLEHGAHDFGGHRAHALAADQRCYRAMPHSAPV